MPTYLINDFHVIAAEPLTSDQEELLVYGVVKARAFSDSALMQTIRALEVESQCTSPAQVLDHLPSAFVIHIQANFRTHTPLEFVSALHRLKTLLLKLSSGLRSSDLSFKQHGMEYFEIKADSGSAVPYVKKTWSEIGQIVMGSLSGKGGKCLNVNLDTYINKSQIYLDFAKLKAHNAEDVTDTIIHEATHKFLASLDNTLTCPWKHASVYYADWRKLGVDPPLNELWSSLAPDEALQNAYSLANYVHYMPKDDLLAFHHGIRIADRAIGNPQSNRKVFDSISNSDL
jgi:hypothetical protein